MSKTESRGPLYHVLRAQQFDRALLDRLCDLTTRIRKVAKVKEGADYLQSLLSNKRAILYFTQPSTRTFLSFQNACHILGIRTSEIRDPSTSSEYKGESPEDAIRTFSSYVDVIIMRSPIAGFADRTAAMLDETDRPVPVINAGSGKDQHPTQALLDIYTLYRSFKDRGGIDGKTIAMVGDLARGRTVRSLSYLMKNYRDVRLIFVAPPSRRMGDDIKAFLDKMGIPWKETEDLAGILPEVDAVYMTRLQDEYDEAGESKKIDYDKFAFRPEHLEILPETAIIMHPLPRRNELHPGVDKDPRAKYWRQERNGMWMRVAILATIFGIEKDILDPYGRSSHV